MDPEQRKINDRAASRRWAKANPERVKAKCKKSKEKHAERAKRTVRLWREKNKERLKIYARENYLKRKEKMRAYNREDHIRRSASPEFRKRKVANALRWAKANPEKMKANRKVRHAKTYGAAIVDPEKVEAFYTFVRVAPRLRCYYCKKVTRKRDRHVDHILPLARGGAHAVENLCCSCRVCNQRKHTKTDEEFTGQLNLIGRQ